MNALLRCVVCHATVIPDLTFNSPPARNWTWSFNFSVNLSHSICVISPTGDMGCGALPRKG